MRELAIALIRAHSPQAKGRVERSFGTAQDRWVKELRLAGVTTCTAANAVLERLLPHYPGIEVELSIDAGFTDIRLPYPIHPSNADRVVALLDRTRLSFIVDHLGVAQSPVSPPEAMSWGPFEDLLKLAKYPNVAVKATGGPSYSTEIYPYRNIHKYIKQIFDAFGPQRLFWGTDITRMPCPWRQCVTLFTEELPWLSESDKTWIMGRGLCEWLQWRECGSAS